MEVLPHEFYMTNYIKDIYEYMNNIFKGEYNKSTIEYLLKLQYFNNLIEQIISFNFSMFVFSDLATKINLYNLIHA